jgi:hypothetical protein
MTDAEKIELLRVKLEETLSENDKLRTLVERLTAGASAHDTLSELHRNRDLPAMVRARAAIGCLGVESAPLKSIEPPLELTAEPYEPLADVVARQRARADAMLREMQDIEVLPNGTVRVLPKPGGNAAAGSDD